MTRKIVIFFSGLKIRENVVVLHCLVFDNFELTEKISKSQKIVKIPIFKAFFYGSIFSWSFDFTLKLRSRHLPELSAEKWSKNQSQSSCKSIINRRNERKKNIEMWVFVRILIHSKHFFVKLTWFFNQSDICYQLSITLSLLRNNIIFIHFSRQNKVVNSNLAENRNIFTNFFPVKEFIIFFVKSKLSKGI